MATLIGLLFNWDLGQKVTLHCSLVKLNVVSENTQSWATALHCWLVGFPIVWNVLFIFFFCPYQAQSLVSLQGLVEDYSLSVIQHFSAASSHVEWLSATILLNKQLLHASYDLSAHPSKAVCYSQRGPALGSGFHHRCLMNSRDLYPNRQWSQAKSRGPWKEDASSSLGNLSWTVIGATHSWRRICPTLKA